MGPWSPAVHALLTHLERVGFAGAPRFAGTGEYEGRAVEWLSWIDGHEIDAGEYAIGALADLGRLIRALHDATAGFVLPPGIDWTHPSETEVDGEFVICHNDLAPRNTVCRDDHPVAFIDWDLAALGPRLWDIAHAIWQFVPLRRDSKLDVDRTRAIVAGYGMPEIVPPDLARIIALRMERTASGIAQLASSGEEAFVRLRDQGVVTSIREDREWVLAHATEIDRPRSS